jgi:8-oxo-dGTP diphosphatase
MSVDVKLVVACALIDIDGRLLITKRPEGRPFAGLWEFPGGKVERGETPEMALVRELKEELNIEVNERCLAPLTFASHGYDEFHLLMPIFACRRWNGEITAQESQDFAWVRPNRLINYPMPPADEPIKSMLRDFFG